MTELPGVSGQTKGLFAPHARSPALVQHETAEQVQAQQTDDVAENTGKADTYERRRQVLGQHIGNIDQLLHRFEVLRCR